MTRGLIINLENRLPRRFASPCTTCLVLLCLAIGAGAQARTRTTKNATKIATKNTTKDVSKEAVKTCPDNKGLPADAITELLDAQNNIRAQLKLAKVTWNCKMADYAQEWANRGIFEHRSNNKYGENIYVSSNA